VPRILDQLKDYVQDSETETTPVVDSLGDVVCVFCGGFGRPGTICVCGRIDLRDDEDFEDDVMIQESRDV